jgi:hypothetical protein
MDQSSMSQAKQSLIDAKEPDIDVISRASYLRSHEMSSDGDNSSITQPIAYQDPGIVNLHTGNGNSCFNKKLSNKRSTFLNDEEDGDMQNVDEFYGQEHITRYVKIGRLAANRRVLKALPITKESFLNWNNKQSMLKSFATSQEASFVSNRPTEIKESNRVSHELGNPGAVLKYEQQFVKMNALNLSHGNNRKKPIDYVIKEVEESHSNFSSAFIEESSCVFEEHAAQSFNREASKASNRHSSKPSNLQNMRQERLHNWNKVHDYQFLKAHKQPKDSVVVSRNKGDDALVMKESMDFIENFSEEEFLSTPEESKSLMVTFEYSN